MASIQIPVHGGTHVTLVHMENMDHDKARAVYQVMSQIVALVNHPPTGSFAERRMMGRFKNVKAIMVESPYLHELRKKVVELLFASDVHPSQTFGGYKPHVSKPYDEWMHGDMVPFEPWAEFHWSKLDAPVSFGLG